MPVLILTLSKITTFLTFFKSDKSNLMNFKKNFCWQAIKKTSKTMIVLLLLFSTNSFAAKDNSPNVLLITVDDLNAWVGALNKHPLAKTPNIDKLAAKGISFTNAHAAAPVCAASRAALMSGVSPHKSGFYTNGNHKVNAHSVINKVPHLAELFRQSGYTTIGAGKIYHRWVTDESEQLDAATYDQFLPLETVFPTQDMLANGEGYKGYKFYPFPDGGTRLKRELNITKGISLSAGPVERRNMRDGKMPDEVIASWAVEQLNQYGKKTKQAQKPFFMTLGFLRPHVPFTAPKEYFDMFPLDKIKLPKPGDMKDIPLYGKAMAMGIIPGGDHGVVLSLGNTFWKELIQGYLASIAFVDAQVGLVLDAIEKNELSDNTLIVLTSDHGQNLGEKSNWRKMSLWEESTRVPFIVSSGALKNKGEQVNVAVSLLDIYPTLVSYLNLPPQNHLDGNDLTPLLNNPYMNWDKPALIAWRYKNFAVRSNRYRYIQYRDGTEELYDHVNDPLEQINLAGKIEANNVITKLKQYIPSDVALPHDKDAWQGDVLDEFISDWQKNGQPVWLN